MGVSCSSIDGNEEDTENKTQLQSAPSSPRRLHKMPQFKGLSTRSQPKPDWRDAVEKREFESPEDYDAALRSLQLAEKAVAFDHDVVTTSSKLERLAVDLVRKIIAYDLEQATNNKQNSTGRTSQPKLPGDHFLGNIDLINETELMKVARRMPKGAHLHIHFNSCLPAKFLIQQARNIDAMYIRSTEPLTTRQNFVDARISFMVMTRHEATHAKGSDGVETETPLGNIFNSTDYVSNQWMSYKEFQRNFRYFDENQVLLKGTKGAETWLERKMIISEEEAHATQQTGKGIWEKFNYRTQMMKGLFAYESAFRKYTRACIRDFVSDNIQYAEIRPNFMSTNSVKTDDGTSSFGNAEIMKIIEEELHKTMVEIKKDGEYFGGMKVIYCTPRSFKKEQIESALNECIDLKSRFGNLVCGFDLVGHEEMGNELRHFVPEFLRFQKTCREQNLEIPFLFHCGETLQVGDKVDGNLYDAILLNSKRIGHGYAIAAHPLLMRIFKEKNMAIESCPISNEILGLTPVMAGHNLPILLANDVPCTINSDNATFYRSSLSHDFYQVMIGSEAMTLLGWKQLAKWSLEHSCMNAEERKEVTKEWTNKWREYCQWIVGEYGPRLKRWEPSSNF